jgi:hypothetical protein
MSGFVSSPAAAAAPEPEAPLEHDAFFPGIKLSTVRDVARVPSQVTEPRLVEAVISAMLTVGTELEAWAAEQIAAGKATHADVSELEVGGQPRLVRLYERALASFTAAELADTHHDISATADGKARAEERALASDEHRRNGTHAIRDIRGTTRTAVELI